MDDDERTGDCPTKPMEKMKWRRNTSPGERERTKDVYIHEKNNAIPNNERAKKKGIPYLLRPNLPPTNLTRRGKGGKGQGDKNPQ